MYNKELDAVIADLVARAHTLVTTPGALIALDDSAAPYDRILDEIGELDAMSGDSLAAGRYLEFNNGTREAIYLIDRVGAAHVHTIKLPHPNTYDAPEIDPRGYIDRQAAAQNIRARERRHSLLDH